jgi:hypothetical protein
MKDPVWARRYILDTEFALMHNARVPYHLAHHLYADGPIIIRSDRFKGIQDVEAFFEASINKTPNSALNEVLLPSLLNMFTREMISSNIYKDGSIDVMNANKSFNSIKFLLLIAHYTKTTCQQHFKTRFGAAVVDNFIQLESCRRLVEEPKMLTRDIMLAAMEKLCKEGDDSFSLAYNAAKVENE